MLTLFLMICSILLTSAKSISKAKFLRFIFFNSSKNLLESIDISGFFIPLASKISTTLDDTIALFILALSKLD